MKYNDCGGGEIFTKTEVQAMPNPDTREYFDTSFYRQFVPQGKINFYLMIDSVGGTCCSIIEMDGSCNLGFSAIKDIVDNMPAWQPAVQNGKKVNSYVPMGLAFEKNRVQISIVKPALGAGAEKVYVNGTITTMAGETVSCLIALGASYQNEVSVKKFATAEPEEFPVSNIKYLVTGYSRFEHISYTENGKQVEKLVWLKRKGHIDLFGEELFLTKEQWQVQHALGKQPEVTYIRNIIRKEGVIYLLSPENFTHIIRPLIMDAPKLIKKLDAEEYNYDNVDELVRRYNNL